MVVNRSRSYPRSRGCFSYNTKGSNLTAVWFNATGFDLTVNVKKSHQKLKIRVILNRKRPSKCIVFFHRFFSSVRLPEFPTLLLGAFWLAERLTLFVALNSKLENVNRLCLFIYSVTWRIFRRNHERNNANNRPSFKYSAKVYIVFIYFVEKISFYMLSYY